MSERPSVFGEDAPDAFDPTRPVRFAPVFNALARAFRHEIVGLENLPERGPALLVLHHTPVPIDALLLSHALLRERGRWPRFLAERLIFETPVLSRRAGPWGLVEGNHYQARRRFEHGDLVAVFPGGAGEAWKPFSERRKLRWGDRDGFARLAFKSGVPIVPVACPRAEDLYPVLNDGLAWGARVFGAARRIPLPILMGMGPLPWPFKLVHHVGVPLSSAPRRGERAEDAVARLRGETVSAMEALLQR